MSKYSTLKAEIIASIKRNGAQAITGDLLQEKLLSMIDSLGEFYQFGGLAIPSTEFTPGDEPVVFIAATPGTYTNFGGLVVADNEVALLVWDGSAWSKQTTDIATKSEVSQLGQKSNQMLKKTERVFATPTTDTDEGIEVRSSSGDKLIEITEEKTKINTNLDVNSGDNEKAVSIHDDARDEESVMEIEDDNGKKILKIKTESQIGADEEIVVKDNDGDNIVSINKDGIKARAFLDDGGNPISGTEIKIDDKVFSFHSKQAFSLRFNLQMKNANMVSETLNILKIESAENVLGIVFKNALPTQLSASDITGHTGGYWAYTPCPKYNAGVEIEYNGIMKNNVYPDYGIRRNFLLGADSFSIWFKGDATQEQNKDIRVEISSTVVRVYHSNGNTIASYTKSNYVTMKDLYDAMLADTEDGQPLEDFEMEWFNLDNLSPSDLIQCDVPIVAEYDLEYYDPVWRAFPYYFNVVEKDRLYECEFGYDGTLPYFMIDGYKMRIPNIDFSNANLELTFGTNSISDVIVSDIYVNIVECKQVFPNIKMFYFEGVAEGEEQVGLNASQRRTAGLFDFLRSKGMKYLTMDEIVNFLNGGLHLPPGDYFHIGHDDSGKDVVQSESIRNTYISHSIYPSIGMFVPPVMSDADDYKVLRNLGFQYHVHAVLTSENKNDTYPRRLTGIGDFSYPELKEARELAVDRFITNLGEVPQMWDFHWVTETWNVISYLKNHGFPIMFGGNGTGSINKINRFRIDRVQSDENALTYEDANSHINGILGTYNIMRS